MSIAIIPLHLYILKNNPNDVIWWVDKPDNIGEWLFTFNKITVFNMFRDYPHELTEKQKDIFDRENPEWAIFSKIDNTQRGVNDGMLFYLL